MSNKNKMIIAGIDAGNTSIKLQLEDENTVTYENIYAKRSAIDMNSEYELNSKRTPNKRNIKRFLDVEVIDGDNKYSFIFGEQAKKYKTELTERPNDYKANDKQLVMNSIVSLANTIISNEMNNDNWKEILKDEMSYDASISVGLPFYEYHIEGKKEEYKNNFKKTFKINFLNPSYPIKTMNLNIKNVDVDIEGNSAIKQTIFEKGIMDKPLNEIVNKAIVMIDIGCYSIDVVGGRFLEDEDEDGEVFVDFEIVKKLSDGINIGVGSALDNVIMQVKNAYSKEIAQHRVFTRQEIAEAFESENKCIPGTKYNIEPYYTNEIESLGEKIGKLFVDMINAAGYKEEIHSIYIAGGGSLNKILLEKFKSYLVDSNYDVNKIQVSENPLYANARGYYNIALSNFEE